MAKYKRKKGNFKKKKTIKKRLVSKEFLLGLFIVIIMVGSGFGIMFGGFSSSGDNKAEYGDYSFTFSNDMFITKIDGQNVKFYYLPQEVEDINVSEDIINRLKNTMQIDVTSDYDSLVRQEIAGLQFYLKQTLEPIKSLYIRNGFIQENEYNITVITCNDADPSVPVILFEYSNQTSIESEGNCIVIYGESGQELTMQTTRLMYGMLDIIK